MSVAEDVKKLLNLELVKSFEEKPTDPDYEYDYETSYWRWTPTVVDRYGKVLEASHLEPIDLIDDPAQTLRLLRSGFKNTRVSINFYDDGSGGIEMFPDFGEDERIGRAIEFGADTPFGFAVAKACAIARGVWRS